MKYPTLNAIYNILLSSTHQVSHRAVFIFLDSEEKFSIKKSMRKAMLFIHAKKVLEMTLVSISHKARTQCRKKNQKEKEYNEACRAIHVRMSHRQMGPACSSLILSTG